MLPEVFLAWIIAQESIGEPLYGKQMVASAIVNRAFQRKLTPIQVCKQYKQFSCWNSKPSEVKRRIDIERWRRISPTEWGDCFLLAVKIQNELFVPVANVNHYYAPAKCLPKWATKLTNVRVVGRHVFGKL